MDRGAFLPWLVLVVFLTIGAGCSRLGQPPSYGSEDGKQIAQLVEDLNEARADARSFGKLFSGSAPANWKKFNEFLFDVDGSPTVSGTSATARVKVRSDGSGADKGTQEWKFTKQGNAWKIESAPLP